MKEKDLERGGFDQIGSRCGDVPRIGLVRHVRLHRDAASFLRQGKKRNKINSPRFSRFESSNQTAPLPPTVHGVVGSEIKVKYYTMELVKSMLVLTVR